MAGENAPNDNGPVTNGNVPSAAEHTTPQKAAAATENFITTIVLTILDVVVFLAVSIGYICQVSWTHQNRFMLISTECSRNTIVINNNLIYLHPCGIAAFNVVQQEEKKKAFYVKEKAV